MSFNYILFSDVHLGADLVQHVRPSAIGRLRELARVDRDLAAMLEHYRRERDPQRPWCLVIAGDLVDFIGMSVGPDSDPSLATALNADEKRHGLGSAEDHAAAKMRRVARRHRLTFDRLAAFLAEGHHLVLVRGNHDLDFHWEAARQAFVDAVASRCDDAATRAAVARRIEFHPWFYYVEGLLYVEHGHQFDAFCSYPHLLAPLSAADPRRLHWTLSDWLLRLVARPTPGLSSEGHDTSGPLAYLRFGWSLGVVGAARLVYRYVRALTVGWRTGRSLVGDRAAAVRREHEQRMVELAQHTRLGVDRLKALTALWPSSVSSGVLSVLRSAFADRIVLGALLATLLLCLGMVGTPMPIWLTVALTSLASFGVFARWSGKKRRGEVDPTGALRRGAQHIARMLPARFIIMGHTHRPSMEPVGRDATYVNLGHWAVDDLDGAAEDAPRTHLVLRWTGASHRAEFLRWDSELGPRPAEPTG